VMDDTDAKVEGDWTSSTARQPFVGAHYLHDDNKGKGEKSVTFLFPVAQRGTYEVRLAYTPDTNRSKAVPVSVQLVPSMSMREPSKPAVIHLIDQTAPPPIEGMFVSLGRFSVSTQSVVVVIVSNADTTGHVIVDAVQLIKVSNN